ncbi:metallopeptidase [Skermania sp. ID1734]|uniref:metallopeptidase n=1 Tax=Skermania sp. ID1734 TaxID=2597516 RepID=UPI001180CFFF|nr:metallopeptidase [Skermania sp. ID1734]TSE02104.1 metallopeptidase [Skermania sp. ID1734]
MKRNARRSASLWTAAVAFLSVGALTGCTTHTQGRAVSIYNDPFAVAGLPTTDGPTGPRPGVAAANRPVTNTDHGPVDTLATNAIDDIEGYWKTEYPKVFRGTFEPVGELVSWDSTAPRRSALQFCGDRTAGLVNAGYCVSDNTIGWDRKTMLPSMIDSFGPMAVVMVLAHEYGHAVQHHSGLATEDDPGIVREQQADCFAGAFMRYVAEDHAPHFTLNTSTGLNSVLAATVSIRDADPNDPDSVHGSAFERVTAVQIGFTDGPTACAKIDADEIEARRGGLPQAFDDPSDTGELPITADTVKEFDKALTSILPVPNEPNLSLSGSSMRCADARPTPPVSYCPTSNTIGIDLAELAKRGTPNTEPESGLPVTVTGDYTAYVLVASRYTLAVQKSHGQALSDPKTALRAACLSGVITAALGSPDRDPTHGDFVLSPGDLDEAVSALLSDGLAASDVDGRTVPSGFSRVDAFRAGVLGGENACANRYS